MRMCLFLVLVALVVGIASSPPDAVFAEGKAKVKTASSAPATSVTPFSKVVRTRFKKWDLDGDGKLSLDEIHKAMINPRIKGEAAAAIAAFRCIERYAYFRYDKKMPPFTLADLARYEAAG